MIGALLFAILVLAQTNPTIFGHPLHLGYDPAWEALGEGFFLLGSWHLLWYGAIAATLLAWRDLFSPPLAPLSMTVCAGAVLLFTMLVFPGARMLVGDAATPGRATLQFAPVLVVFAALAFRSFARRCASEPSKGQAQNA
jgi:hypothetical protein